SLDIWDREERTQATSASAFCWTSNVVTFNGSNLLGSSNVTTVTSPFQQGWMKVGFPTGIAGAAGNVHKLINSGATSITTPGGGTTINNTATYVGLPMIGFAVMSSTTTLQLTNPPSTPISNNGSGYPHKTYTTIQ